MRIRDLTFPYFVFEFCACLQFASNNFCIFYGIRKIGLEFWRPIFIQDFASSKTEVLLKINAFSRLKLQLDKRRHPRLKAQKCCLRTSKLSVTVREVSRDRKFDFFVGRIRHRLTSEQSHN